MKTPYDIVKKPLISERSMDDMADKKYTFIVDINSNKTEIKKAVEEIFGVEVEKVNTMRVKGKYKRMGKNIGKRADRKKAVIKLTPNSKEIEFFEGMQ
ncbi:50S ribosomal protein L23 [Crassaminicella profunda]|uniref:50S ribosomal protein L23 n=1 Tax=Crassaminicella profunda TaxID=1286698 RepID=UPI001CA62E7C|nr:50S ribosomal protein L23 [Crassaminicella profunda]QZY54625.1 50S ribosomal protein L23 [Crassaminicella profunda]